MLYLPLRILTCIFLIEFSLGLSSASRAQESSSSWCKPEQLDLNLGLRGDSVSSNTHWLTIEFLNRAASACKLHAGLEGEDLLYKDSSPAAVAFREKSQNIPPGGLVHLFFAWTSAPAALDGIVFDQCRMNDNMTINPLGDPWLELRHLWARTCSSWWSGFRLGPYKAGEPISKEWLDHVHLQESDFSASDPPAAGNAKLWTLSNFQYLQGSFGSGYYNVFPLILELPSGGFANCPLHSVRKREADGKTTIYLTSCEDQLKLLSKHNETKAMGLWTNDLGLSPERTGHVEYEVVSNVMLGGKPITAAGRMEVAVRDPNQPMLPTIDTNSPSCLISQLKLSSPIVELGNHW